MVGMSRTILANGVDNSAMVKTGHYHSHNRPIEVKNGQYPTSRKEHIANREQIVYIAPSLAVRCRSSESGPIRSGSNDHRVTSRRRFHHG